MNTRPKSIASNATADMNVSSNTLHIPDGPTQEEPMPPWARVMVESMQATNVNLQATNANLQALIDENDQHDHENENLESLEEPMPFWARELIENLEAINIRMQALISKLDQHDNEDENLESLEEPTPTWARALMEEIDQIDMRLQKLESQDESNSWEDNSLQIEIPDEPINDYPHFSLVPPAGCPATPLVPPADCAQPVRPRSPPPTHLLTSARAFQLTPECPSLARVLASRPAHALALLASFLASVSPQRTTSPSA